MRPASVFFLSRGQSAWLGSFGNVSRLVEVLSALGIDSGQITSKREVIPTQGLPTTRSESPSRSTCFDFLDDLRNNATCFARRIAALSNLRPAPASWTRSTDPPAGSEGSSRSGVIARRFKGRRRNLEILSVSQRRFA